jgi:hypothetical protein
MARMIYYGGEALETVAPVKIVDIVDSGVQIVPKTAEGLLLMQGEALVNGKTLTVSLAEAQGLDLEALLYTTATDSTAPAAVTWKSSATGVARVDANGHVTLLKAGTAKITVTQGKLIATVTIKVTK